MAAYESGYDDERFEQTVSQTLHCIICTNVIKDPVMCPENEHLFCRACITTHLMYSQTCPTCMQPLTVETLRQASRGIRNMLAELRIRCEFFDRGCGKIVDLGDLERHMADCGFAPAVCSNEGCQLELNKQDLLHHETAVCELRRVRCHSCNDIRREMDTVKVNLSSVNEKLLGIEKNGKVVEAVLAEVGQLRQSNRRLEADNAEIKKNLNEITKQLERMAQQRLHENGTDKVKRETAETDIDEEVTKPQQHGSHNNRDNQRKTDWRDEERKTDCMARQGAKDRLRKTEGRDDQRKTGWGDDQRKTGWRDDQRKTEGRDDQRKTEGRDDQRKTEGRDDQRQTEGRDRDDQRKTEGRDDRRKTGWRDDQRKTGWRDDQRKTDRRDRDDQRKTEGRDDQRKTDRRDRDDQRKTEGRDDRRITGWGDDQRKTGWRDEGERQTAKDRWARRSAKDRLAR